MRLLTCVMAVVALAGLSSVAAAEEKPALKGYCPAAYLLVGKAVEGKPEFKSTYKDQTYYLASAEAKEKFGSTVVGNGQVWLLVESEQRPGVTKLILPFAMISRAAGDSNELGRWLFNRQDVFIPSVGGGHVSPMFSNTKLPVP